MNYKEELIKKINQLLSGEINVSEFEASYYSFFLNEVPENVLNDKDNSFFAEVQEKLDWTTEKPTKEEINNGWMNYKQYTEWLMKEKEDWLKS